MTMMSLEERLERALDERDLISIKSHLTSFIDKYPRNENDAVTRAFDLARRRCPELEQPHDGERLMQSHTVWDEEYLALLMDDLIDNFSTERFFHTLEVSAHLHRRKHDETEPTEEEPPPRRMDLTTWVLLVVAAIVFLVLVALIRSAL